jgi:uncharacterized membrane protein YcaP (DUF421 family)
MIHDFLGKYPFIAIAARCVAVYLSIILGIRLFGKKELAQLSVTDLVFILLISNAVQNAMVGPDTSLLGGLIAALALFLINAAFKQVLYRSKSFNRLLQGDSTMLIYKGAVQEPNLQQARITRDELLAAVREHGVPDFEHVNLAVLEVDGNISIISNDFSKESLQPGPQHPHFRHRVRPRVRNNK